MSRVWQEKLDEEGKEMNKEYIERETAVAFLENMAASRYLIQCFENKEKFPAVDVAPIKYAYWDWQCDGTHFCSECGTDALFNYEGEEFCSTWCPHCGCYMTHQEDQI